MEVDLESWRLQVWIPVIILIKLNNQTLNLKAYSLILQNKKYNKGKKN